MKFDYEHDVFISYKREQTECSDWVRDFVFDQLQSVLSGNIIESRVFIDKSIREGARFAEVLHRKIARSRVLVAFLSVAYFRSRWCRRELALMLEREEAVGLSGSGENYGLVIPVWMMDGKRYPHFINRFHRRDFNKFCPGCRSHAAQAYEEFTTELKHLVEAICVSIEKSPLCRPEWENFTGDLHFNKLRAKSTVQKENPRNRI